MKQFLKIFHKVNGVQILKQYNRARVLSFALIETAIIGLDSKSLEIVRLAVNNKLLKKMRKKNKKIINEFKKYKVVSEKNEEISNYIWVCWFQGLEYAPEIVKKCYKSLEKNIKNKKIILITKKNYSEYVTLPEYIVDKYEKNIISQAHFADLIRLELLIKYGGTWIDSTVFCSSDKIPSYMLDSDLFLFKTLKPGLDGHAISISNWFITSQKNNAILELTLLLLYKYWSKNDKLIDYFIFHFFFELACEAYPEIWGKVIPTTNSTPHNLLLNLFESYEEDRLKEIINQSVFHKLTYKFGEEEVKIKGTNYEYFMNYIE